MLGTFRLVLALLVALSHVDVRIAGLNPGVVAVVCFYLISGYVMTGLLRDHYPSMRRIPHFYGDRALRIFPQYLVVAGLTLAWFLIVGEHTAFLKHGPQWSDFLANATVVPLNYYMFNGSDSFTLIPPAWSLGAEIQFYLLMPFILLWQLRRSALAIGIMVFVAAAWGWLNTDTYGYRLLPGVLTFFLLGSVLYDACFRPDKRDKYIVIFVMIGAAIGVLTLARFDHLMLPYNRETFVGILIGMPVLYWLGRLPQHWLDNRLGDLSYGVFLNHFFIQWVLIGTPVGVSALIKYLVMSLILSAVVQYLFERPVLRWRHGLRVNKLGREKLLNVGAAPVTKEAGLR